MEKYKSLIIFMIICLIILIIPIAIYVMYFKTGQISNSTTDWGSYGSFVGGILSPIFAIINIGVFYYLTLKVTEIEENRKSYEIDIENHRVLNNLRINAYKETQAIILEAIKLISNDENIELFPLRFKYIFEINNVFFSSIDIDIVDNIIDEMRKKDKLNKNDKIELITNLNSLLLNIINEINITNVNNYAQQSV